MYFTDINLKQVMIMTENETLKKTEELAAGVMQISVAALLLNMRFLARAVNRLPYYSSGKGFTCDGLKLSYESELVLKRYKKSERLPVHDYLHMLLHCIFRHWKVGAAVDEKAWNAACDIASEAVIFRCAPEFRDTDNENAKQKISHDMDLRFKPLTAEKIYSYFMKNDISREQLDEFIALFGIDDHKVWYKNRKREYEPEEKVDVLNIGYPDEEHSGQNSNSGSGPGEQGKLLSDAEDPGSGSDGSNENRDESAEREGSEDERDPESGPDDGTGENNDDPSLEDWLMQSRAEQLEKLEDMWKEISEQIESDLNNFSKNSGRDSKYLTDIISNVNRDRYDYAAFLRRFAVSGEVMRPDPECFDVNFYSYGLDLYGNVALIEPLENKEVRLVRDFVIAIDTSGSVSGALVKGFISKTYSILKSEESFFTKVNIYIIQCDTEVREAKKITDNTEFEKYLNELEIKGLGGTDFRPVFEQVDTLVDKGEFKNLKGLIYFTDGFGTFPEYKPTYETAFAFLRSDYDANEPPDIPPWAVKLILEEDDVLYD